ncbi:hypothetical protein ACQP1O_20440 [Nocardia sp. CA-151230]
MRAGHVRVGTVDQNTARQLDGIEVVADGRYPLLAHVAELVPAQQD